MTEQWRDIPGYEGLYQVSNHGRVRSMRQDPPLVLKFGRVSSKGYPSVCLCDAPRPPRTVPVHRLVAEAFLPPDDTRPHVNHKDGDVHNNHVSNLEWCTPAENILHAREVLGHNMSALGYRKLSGKQLERALAMRRAKTSPVEIAHAMGMGVTAVVRAVLEAAPETKFTNKLSDADVPQIQAMRDAGHTLKQIATEFGVTDSMICRVLKGNRRNPANRKEQAS